MPKKIKSERQLKEELEKLKRKAPRVGVRPTKVVPDKTKYNRAREKKVGL